MASSQLGWTTRRKRFAKRMRSGGLSLEEQRAQDYADLRRARGNASQVTAARDFLDGNPVRTLNEKDRRLLGLPSILETMMEAHKTRSYRHP